MASSEVKTPKRLEAFLELYELDEFDKLIYMHAAKDQPIENIVQEIEEKEKLLPISE